MPQLTTKQQLLSRMVKVKEIHFPNSDDTAFIRKMTGTHRDRWQEVVKDELEKQTPIPGGIIEFLVTYSLCDQEGKLIFKEEEASLIHESYDCDDIEFLGEQIAIWNNLGEKAQAEVEKKCEGTIGPSLSDDVALNTDTPAKDNS